MTAWTDMAGARARHPRRAARLVDGARVVVVGGRYAGKCEHAPSPAVVVDWRTLGRGDG